MLSYVGHTAHYDCENCLRPAHQLRTDYGDYCNRCWFTYKVTTAEFQDMLDRYM
ncbi:hypothetical protein [Nocardia australiensis]|uniref:hypothetical protein n=1 Tax=Nocardia australiensis TaxID=2887191 RepID=UPI001D13E6DC|nr:hypothetical protein [Nocardia australiensis]